MLTAETVKRQAKQCGADIVGIASMDRFEGAPKQADPRYIFPDAKSMIVMGFRILRGTLRGIEEGTFFTAYSSLGYASINKLQQPIVLLNFSKFLEDEGYEAVPIPNNFVWNGADASGQKPGGLDTPRSDHYSRPVAPGLPAPDVFVHLRIAAFCAGLGEIGFSKMFLTPEFGPRIRLAAVLTDAPLEPDPVMKPGTLCDRCMLCVRDCSGNCIRRDQTVKVRIAGYDVEWSDLDMEKCSHYFCGASKERNPFMVTKEDEEEFATGNVKEHKVTYQLDHGRALEGARGCIRACMIHLEKQGKLKNAFKHPFRRHEEWKLPNDPLPSKADLDAAQDR